MSKQKKGPQYVIEVSCQIMRKVFEAKANESAAPKRDAAQILREITANNSGCFESFKRFFDEVWIEASEVVQKMKMAEVTLAKIIAYGLHSGDEPQNGGVCTITYRRTGFMVISGNPADEYARLANKNGREMLEDLATRVIISAFYDHQKVIQIVRNGDGEITFNEAGEKYLMPSRPPQ